MPRPKTRPTAVRRYRKSSRKLKTAPDFNITQEIVEDAEQLILTGSGSETKSLSGREWLNFLPAHLAEQKKISRREHYETLARAYATFVKLQGDPDVSEKLIAGALARGRLINGKVSMLRLIIELHLSYGDSKDRLQNRAAQKCYSRDEKALLTLMERGIRPSDVASLSEKPKEGLDAWARRKPALEVDAIGSANSSEVEGETLNSTTTPKSLMARKKKVIGSDEPPEGASKVTLLLGCHTLTLTHAISGRFERTFRMPKDAHVLRQLKALLNEGG